MRLPGTVARREGDPPTGDMAVDEAYSGLGITYDFFWDIYERNSIDDKGIPLYAVVHYGKAYNNAFWNGKQLIIGDGDGQIFNRFTIAVDVIANQLAHGIIQAETQLNYWRQSGALIESISDVFGSLVKQYLLSQTANQADWLVGAGLWHPKVRGEALRSLAAPGTAYDDPSMGKDPQPAHMRNYMRITEDNGGVHINSGIPNHAFYLIAIELGGYAWEKAGRIWYETVKDKKLKPEAQFRDFARITLAKARQLYGNNSDEVKAVKHSWDTVGIKLTRA
jgi:Zn-dependent metalloprotease